MNYKTKKRVIVIGINHAGTSAVKIMLENYSDKVEVIGYDANDNISFLGCGISIWIKKGLKNSKVLFYSDALQLKKLGAKINMNHQLLSIDKENKTIQLKNVITNKIVTDHYDKLIVGIGSLPIAPPFSGINLNNILFSKFFHDAEKLVKASEDKNIKTIAIVGGGYIGVELAEALYARGKKIVLIDMLDRIMKNYYNETFTKQIEDTMCKKGLNLVFNEKIIGFLGDKNNNVTTVKTNKNTYNVDLVVLAVGFHPNTKLFKNILKLNTRGAIEVNKYMQTSDPDIYAIGDSVAIKNNFCKDCFDIALASNAVRTGIVAGINVANDNIYSFNGVQGSSALSVFGWKIGATGLSVNYAINHNINHKVVFHKSWDLPAFIANREKVMLQLIYDPQTRKILGAQICSKNNHSEVIYFFSLAILKGVTIDELQMIDLFFLPHFNTPLNFITAIGFKANNLHFTHKI